MLNFNISHFAIDLPFHPLDENREEPDLTVDPAWRDRVKKKSPQKAVYLDVIMKHVCQHPDFLNDVERGCSIFLRGRLYLQLEQFPEETLCNWACLIENDFSSMDLEEKYELAKSHCEAYYDTATGKYYDNRGDVITNGSRLVLHPMVYYAISLDKDDNVIVITAGKSMGPSRFSDYANRRASKIPRSCDEDGKAPARIVLCFMACLTHLGSCSDAQDHPFPNLRNRSVEEAEAVGLMILFETILGHGMYGDVRSMSAKELSKRWQYLYKKYGFAAFGWSADTWSQKLGCKRGKAHKKGGKVGAPKGKPQQARGDGAYRRFPDPADPSRFATFCYHTKKDGIEAEGSLLWIVDRKPAKQNGHVYYTLVGDGSKKVDRDMPIYYITPDGEKVDVRHEIENRYPMPTPWVCIEGVGKKYSEDDAKEELERGLQGGVASDDTDGIEFEVLRWNDGRIFVKFGKVWDARGCAIVLDGTKKLFGGSSKIGVSCVLENDLPDTLKISEARKRDRKSADRKAAKAAKAAVSDEEMEIEEHD